MERFGDRPHDEITPAEVAAFLRDLDAEGLSARNVNLHRSILHAVFVYAMKPETYALAANPVTRIDKRYEQPPAPLDHYEVDEIEALARACERGEQRASVPNYRGRLAAIGDDELAARSLEDRQDRRAVPRAVLQRVRFGEVIALR